MTKYLGVVKSGKKWVGGHFGFSNLPPVAILDSNFCQNR